MSARGFDRAAAADMPLLPLLKLERIDAHTFRGGENEDNRNNSVFGGQLLGQALCAAAATAPGRRAHSLHGYFLRAGAPQMPVIYRVEHLRDGANFSSRRVRAEQDGRCIFEMLASFDSAAAGVEHQAVMPDVPPPEQLETLRELLTTHADRLPDYTRARLGAIRTVDIKPCDPQGYLLEQVDRRRGSYWIRARLPVPADPGIQQCALAYVSDYWLLGAALLPYGRAVIAPEITAVSLDHAIWFHRAGRVDDWLLYTTESPSANNARALVKGMMFDRDGRLLASVAQEGLIRIDGASGATG